MTAVLAFVIGLGPVAAARSPRFQTNTDQQQPSQQVVILAVQGMT
jgi:hypothetical protein